MSSAARFLSVLAAASALAAGPIAASAQGQPAAAAPPAAAPLPAGSSDPVERTEDPAVTARAKDIFQRFQARTFDTAALSDDYAKALPPETIANAETQLAALGGVQRVAFDGSVKRADITAYVYHFYTPGGIVDEVMLIDNHDKIARLAFRIHPAGASPAPDAAPGSGAAPAPAPAASAPGATH